jgi:hypothetical protein
MTRLAALLLSLWPAPDASVADLARFLDHETAQRERAFLRCRRAWRAGQQLYIDAYYYLPWQNAIQDVDDRAVAWDDLLSAWDWSEPNPLAVNDPDFRRERVFYWLARLRRDLGEWRWRMGMMPLTDPAIPCVVAR